MLGKHGTIANNVADGEINPISNYISYDLDLRIDA